jgi:hypothetical protein
MLEHAGVALEGNFVCLDYQFLKDYFSKTTNGN